MAETGNNAERLIARITDAARAEASQTLANADAECKKTALVAENDIFDIESEAQLKMKREREGITERSRTNASLDARKYALGARRAVVDEAFEKAGAALAALPKEKRSALIEKLLIKESEGGECVLFSEEDDNLLAGGGSLLQRVNEALAAAGKKPLVTGEATKTITGGFILRTPGYEKNCSFEAILRDARAVCESEVAAILFG